MKTFNLFLAVLATSFCFSQEIKTGKVNKVNSNGLHKIIVPITIRSASNDDLSDFRILDSKANEVPYFINKNSELFSESNYKEYKIISKSEVPKKQSLVIFENPDETINRVDLIIANYEGEKAYTLSGSNDQKQWFGIANNKYLTDLSTVDSTTVTKTISFPLNNYKYIKIELDDKNSLPIRIIAIRNINYEKIKSLFLPINYKSKTVTELTPQKKTLIHFQFEEAITVDRMEFKISSPTLYKRYVLIYKSDPRKLNSENDKMQQFIANIQLHSDSRNSFATADIKEKDLYFEIDNQDNQPLVIDEISFFQEPLTIICDLKTNESYTITTGNKDLTKPVYDIENFKSSIPSNLPTTTISEIKSAQKSVGNKPAESLWQKSWFMWLCIIIAGITIVYFTRNLLSDMNKQ